MSQAINATTFRFPDKPCGNLTRQGLETIRGGYLATLKMDGWRCVVQIDQDGHITYTSRFNKPIPISAELRVRFEGVLLASDLPPDTVLDGEWLARRPAARDEAIWIFDVMRLGGDDLWHLGAFKRFETLRLAIPHAGIIVPYSTWDYGGFFDENRQRTDAEGIVLKGCNSRYIGSVRESALNPSWLRCKWRAGEDGQTEIEP